MLKLLYVSGGLFVLSLFTFNEIFLTVALTLFVIAVVLNCCKLWEGQAVFNVVADKSFDNAKKHFKNKKYGKAATSGKWTNATPLPPTRKKENSTPLAK